MNMTKRTFVKSLAESNRQFYGTPEGNGFLRALDLTFGNRWIYLYELVQNALDAKANSISMRLAEDERALIFQHDGQSPITKKDVEGLSQVFRSTKGAASVGFMGIGFKSVFRRFGEAWVSGWGWTFRYKVPQEQGEEYGDLQRDMLGAVIPQWDDAIEAPTDGFTTRFEMRQCLDSKTDLRSDLARFLPDKDRTLLAILASCGLTRLEVDKQVWELGVTGDSDECREAVALSKKENLLWQIFSVKYEPSRDAIARFLEHRKIRPSPEERDQVYSAAARSRRVLGVLPLDDNGVPAPPSRGRVYATLPTDVKLPFGLHIHADWLLTISRTELLEIEENAWQSDIVDQIANVLANFLKWVPTLSTPERIKAAFSALRPPSPDTNGLEALLTKDRWLRRLQGLIEDAAVLPVWTEASGVLTFSKPSKTIIPPTALADAFTKKPDLRPAVLLNGPVLAGEILGSGTRKLLSYNGFLSEMSPQELERVWADGLEDWWDALGVNESERRDLLFHLWAAIYDLTVANEDWITTDLRCVRTDSGVWISVNEAKFFNEALPTEKEPGGTNVREFIRSSLPDADHCLPYAWIRVLQQRAEEDTRLPLSKAWAWLDEYARLVSLQEIIEIAMNALATASAPDWSILVPLGHWARHRNRPDLIIHVLVESDGVKKGVSIDEALLADPYVEHGQSRRLLFPALWSISADYIDQDPDSARAYQWRTFFENSGAKGALEVQPIPSHRSRSEQQQVEEFLGRSVSESNNSGYTLFDFDIVPTLPDPSAPDEVRKTIYTWIEDGFRNLRNTGLRYVSYFYYSPDKPRGPHSSRWVRKLSQLAWVPCIDGQLRPPEDVLPTYDPARENAPVAVLSADLIDVLNDEGVRFGTAIPEARSLQKLLALGSKLDPSKLSSLIREVREEIETDEDREHFKRALRDLTVPSDEGKRVPLQRIVQQTRGQLRGTLGGWIFPLTRIDEALQIELLHPDFPHKFPKTTTGKQALEYIQEVWQRAQSSPEGLANEVRDVLPTAYAYCLADCDEDLSLSEQWDVALSEAMVFADREWIALNGTDDIYFDDLEDRRFLPSGVELRTVTSGHLGNSKNAQLRTSTAMGLQTLSSCIEMNWQHGVSIETDWSPRFHLICDLLRHVRGSEQMTREDEYHWDLFIDRIEKLNLAVRIGDTDEENVPVNARLHDGCLTVTGRPIQFGADAAKELLSHFSFGQRGDLSADLTGLLGAIDHEEDFRLAVQKFMRSFAQDFELPSEFSSQPSGEETQTQERVNGQDTGTDDDRKNQTDPNDEHTTGNGGSYTRKRALSRQRALAEELKNSLKGEVVIDNENSDENEPKDPTKDASELLGDEIYRKVAAKYERQSGRKPKLGDSHQEGWDLRSVDPDTGLERLIEVKGKGCKWIDDEVVELSRAQVRKAFETSDKAEWYLYVIERLDNESYRVLPILNPVATATKWMLSGQSWRMIAKEPRCITVANTSQNCSQSSE